MNMHSSDKSFAFLSEILEEKTGQTILPNRHFRIQSSLQPIMRENSIPDIDALVSVLNSSKNSDLEIDCLEAILNNETCFFRDQASFVLLTSQLLDALRIVREKERKIRIWSSACSFGQESLSLAIALSENQQKWDDWSVEILCSDVSNKALNRAKKGIYSQFEVQRGLPIGLLVKYFDKVGDDWQVKTKILDMLHYHHYNMVDGTQNMGKFDLILCRNMMMYLSDANKIKTLLNIEKSLHSKGYLMIGASETISTHSDKFIPCNDYKGFYKFKDNMA